MSIRTALPCTLALALAACVAEVPRAELADLRAPVETPSLDVEPYRAAVNGLIRDGLTSGHAYEMLRELCTTAPHRLSGSDDAAKAVEWAQRTMRAIGLANVRAEPVMVPHWVRGTRAELRSLGVDDQPWRVYEVLALGGSVGTPPEGLKAGVIEVRSFDELRARADEARGKLVLFNRPMDPAQTDCFAAYGGAVDQRGHGASEAAKVGGVGAIVRSMTMSLDEFPHTGAMRYDDGVERVPTVAISTRGADALSAAIRERADLELFLALDCQTLDDAPSANVVGEIVGSESPDEIVVIGAHLDAWDVGQGAHDDGAGCAHVLEAARLILASGLKPRRTIRVVLFMNEENGTRGAQGYFKEHERERHVLALESDAGGFTPRGFSTDANAAALEQLRAIAALLEPASAARVDPGHGGTDIGPLSKLGTPLVGFRPDDERYFDFHHSDKDVLEAVHPRELALGAAAIAGLAYVAADMPQALPANEPQRAAAAH
jgi:Zn-dependent M28 family amino/carboxypeptidase